MKYTSFFTKYKPTQNEEKTPTYVSCNINTLFFSKMIAPANAERINTTSTCASPYTKKIPNHKRTNNKHPPPNNKTTPPKAHTNPLPLKHQENLVPDFPSLHMLILMNFPINIISILHWHQTVSQNETISVLISNGTMKLVVQFISLLLFVEVWATALSRSQ